MTGRQIVLLETAGRERLDSNSNAQSRYLFLHHFVGCDNRWSKLEWRA
jgi:hypothetical protein